MAFEAETTIYLSFPMSSPSFRAFTLKTQSDVLNSKSKEKKSRRDGPEGIELLLGPSSLQGKQDPLCLVTSKGGALLTFVFWTSI